MRPLPVAVAIFAAGAVILAVGPLNRSPARRPVARPTRTLSLSVAPAISALGRALRRAAGRSPDARADRRAGLASLVLVGAFGIGPFPAGALAAAGALTSWWRRARASREVVDERAVVDAVPDLVDLLRLTTGAGLTLPAALPVVSRWAPPTLGGSLQVVRHQLDLGAPTADAVADAARLWGDAGRPLAHALADHLRHGTPLAPALDRVAIDARARRRRQAEARARRLPVLLLFPLVLCTLPAFGLLTVAPIVAGTLRSLDEGRLEASASHPPRSTEAPCQPSIPSPVTSSTTSGTVSLSSSGGHAVTSCPSPPPAGRLASPLPSTHSSSSAPPPSPSCSSRGPVSPAASARCSTPSSTP